MVLEESEPNMACQHIGEYMRLGSIVGSDYYGMVWYGTETDQLDHDLDHILSGNILCSSQNPIWCVNVGECMVFRPS